jgi:H+-transporting ATPase
MEKNRNRSFRKKKQMTSVTAPKMDPAQGPGSQQPVQTPSPQGLSRADVERLRVQYGYNELPEEKRNPVLKFLSYFWGPIPWMIEVAAILSAVVKHWQDFIVIMVLLVVNAVVGFWEEFKAGNTIAALKQSLAVQSRVKRDGAWATVPAKELLPGDLIRLRIGDIIPADANLLKGDPIQVDQSALTGESLPVIHNSGDLVYSGSIVKQGEINAVVTAIGKNTFFGKTAQLVESAHTVSHFQKAVLHIGNVLIILASILAVLILIIAMVRGDPLTTTLQFVLVLTVAAIPVAMPTVLSVTMAVGAQLLAHKKAVVSHLPAIEEMAGMDVLCSDKTGTLTKNQLILGEPYRVHDIPVDDLILEAALASRKEDNDPIDAAVIAGMKNPKRLKDFQILHFQPFDPVHKRTEALVKGPAERTFQVAKGAPQVILELAHPDPQTEKVVNEAINQFAVRGFRSLAVARGIVGDPKDKEKTTWQIRGILPLYDPPREDSKATISAAQQMSVRVKMLTGDQEVIGQEIAKQVGLGTNILKADILDSKKEKNLKNVAELAEQADGFAEVFPEHKYRIVEALQSKGHIVGMTGDGVNDAPALKKADSGIAVSGATDAARSAADLVLLSPGLSVIIDAIRESRKIFQRMNSYATYRIAETIRVLCFMTLSILVFNFYPVTAIMIVLLALLNDGAILSIAYDHVMPSTKPEKWNMRQVITVASVLGVFGMIASFGLFLLGEKVFHLDRNLIQTLIYLKLSVAGHLTIFITRTRGAFWSNRPAPILMAAVGGTQLVATLFAVYGVFMNPIGWGWALVVWGYAIAWFLVNDRIKLLTLHILDRTAK